MNENVIYVTPDGNALSKDEFSRFSQYVSDVWETLKRIFRDVVDSLKAKIEELTQYINQPSIPKINNHWRVPKSTVKCSQVMNNKPVFAVARNNI